MSDYCCVTVVSKPGESQSDFAARLSEFWTHMLRNHPNDFEKVYAETTSFEEVDDCLSRMYLVQTEATQMLENEFVAAGLKHEPIDRDDVYSKYEATPPEWMWIEH